MLGQFWLIIQENIAGFFCLSFDLQEFILLFFACFSQYWLLYRMKNKLLVISSLFRCLKIGFKFKWQACFLFISKRRPGKMKTA